MAKKEVRYPQEHFVNVVNLALVHIRHAVHHRHYDYSEVRSARATQQTQQVLRPHNVDERRRSTLLHRRQNLAFCGEEDGLPRFGVHVVHDALNQLRITTWL